VVEGSGSNGRPFFFASYYSLGEISFLLGPFLRKESWGGLKGFKEGWVTEG